MGEKIKSFFFRLGLCIVGAALFAAAGMFIGYRLWHKPPTPLERGVSLFIEEVTDGDTMVVRMSGERIKVRLMGVDTPETVDKRKAEQCFGKRASIETKKFEGQTLQFEFIPPEWPAVKRDTYGRPLVYLYLPNGELYNEKLIREGLAHEYTYKGGYKYRPQLQDAEKDARTHKRGMWKSTSCAEESSRKKK
ncbi:MAG: thermonuclease family protein [Parcubacteria group bacterium]|nr:thermonuclease family protein [Parcubacteria group bacterium]